MVRDGNPRDLNILYLLCCPPISNPINVAEIKTPFRHAYETHILGPIWKKDDGEK